MNTIERPGIEPSWLRVSKQNSRVMISVLQTHGPNNIRELEHYAKHGMTALLAAEPELRQHPPADWDWERFLPIDLTMYGNQRADEFELEGLAGVFDATLAMRAFAAIYTREMIELYGHIRSLRCNPDELPRWMDFKSLPFTAIGVVVGCSGKALHLARLQTAAYRLGFYGTMGAYDYPGLQFILRLFADYLGEAPLTLRGSAASHPIYNALIEAWRRPDPETLKPALLAACDEHTWRGGCRNPGDAHFEWGPFTFDHDFGSWSRVPVEILLLLKLRQILGLTNPTLDHPLMNTALGTLPAEVAYEPDSLIAGVIARMIQDNYDEEAICRAVFHDIVLSPAALASDELGCQTGYKNWQAELERGRKFRTRTPVKIARTILKTPEQDSSWQCLQDNKDSLIWDEYSEADVEWSTLAGRNVGLEDVDRSEDENGNVLYSYKGHSIRVPFKDDRSDGLISIHSLNSLVRGDSELRCCVDSCQYGEFAFLALPPRDWRALERKHGKDAVAYRFLSIAPDLDAFFQEILSGERRRTYWDEAVAQTPSPHESIMEEVNAMAAARSDPTTASWFLGLGTNLSILLVTNTEASRDALFNDKLFVQKLVEHVQNRCKSAGLSLECISFLSREVIDQDAEIECLLKWLDEGFCPQIRFSSSE